MFQRYWIIVRRKSILVAIVCCYNVHYSVAPLIFNRSRFRRLSIHNFNNLIQEFNNSRAKKKEDIYIYNRVSIVIKFNINFIKSMETPANREIQASARRLSRRMEISLARSWNHKFLPITKHKKHKMGFSGNAAKQNRSRVGDATKR